MDDHNSSGVREGLGAADHQNLTTRFPFPSAADPFALIMRCSRGQAIYQEGAPVECWCRVISGSARRFILREDGKRQIVDLLFSGDVFGFGTCGSHVFSAEAIADGTVVAHYPLTRLQMLAGSDPTFAQQLHKMAVQEADRLQRLVLILGRTTAQQKVEAFLLDLAKRLAGQVEDRVNLPISRYDIADYLSLSVETVSRALSALKQNGTIAFAGRREVLMLNSRAMRPNDSG